MTLDLQPATPIVLPNEDPARPWLLDFFKGVRNTWHKITWPTVRQLSIQVLVTVAVTIFATTLIWGLDNLYRILIQTFVLPHA